MRNFRNSWNLSHLAHITSLVYLELFYTTGKRRIQTDYRGTDSWGKPLTNIDHVILVTYTPCVCFRSFSVASVHVTVATVNAGYTSKKLQWLCYFLVYSIRLCYDFLWSSSVSPGRNTFSNILKIVSQKMTRYGSHRFCPWTEPKSRFIPDQHDIIHTTSPQLYHGI